MKEIYEVRFNFTSAPNAKRYTVLETGTKETCEAYVKQAIEKGQEPWRLKIVQEDKFYVKWQAEDLSGAEADRYLGGFRIFENGGFDYDVHTSLHEANFAWPKPVAEWLCQMLEYEGLEPELVKA